MLGWRKVLIFFGGIFTVVGLVVIAYLFDQQPAAVAITTVGGLTAAALGFNIWAKYSPAANGKEE